MKLTKEQFDFLKGKIYQQIYIAMNSDNNKMYEKYIYMYGDLCKDYPEYV